MKYSPWIIVVCVGLVLTGWLLTPRGQADGSPEPSLKVGLIDMNRLFKAYKKTRESETAINDAYTAKRGEFRKLDAQIKRLAAEIDLYAPGSSKRTMKQEELFLLKRRYTFRNKWAEAEFREKLQKTTQTLYNEIIQHIGTYAQKHGYDAIIKIDGGPLSADTQEELKLKIHTRSVLYSRKGLDLTNEIIKLLNQ